MSSTRRAKGDSVFHQSRYASSPEFERGLMGNLVAKRCALLDDKSEREIIWFIQYLSHQEGGLSAIAKDLTTKFSARLQTTAMVEIGMKPGKVCNVNEVRKVRKGLPDEYAKQFLLKGEMAHYSHGIISVPPPSAGWEPEEFALGPEYFEAASQNPISYLASKFVEVCHIAATSAFENFLRELCLDPAIKLDYGPWYFPSLVAALREYKDDFIKEKSTSIVTTALGEKVCEVLDYTAYSRGLTLMQGDARMGKSFAARQWCIQHPGLARFVEVPPSNDDATFFRALARGLGLGNFLKYKVAEIRERVESVLLTGDLLLVLDEAHRLWPQMNPRYGFPSRINWVMTMANHNVPICTIATPQFIQMQKAAEEKGQWNSAQLTGRISHYESLPVDLSAEDLVKVAKSVLPEANAATVRALAVYARSSARYLAAIDSISKRARYIAMRDGRSVATTDDVRKAMQESVIPADTKLQRALENVKKRDHKKMTPIPAGQDMMAGSESEDNLREPVRGNLTLPGSPIRTGNEASLIAA